MPTEPEQQVDHDHGEGGSLSAPQVLRIANGITRVYKEQYGKGPTGIKVHLTDGAVFVLLRGGFSIVEESLRKAGEEVAVRDQRRAFGDTAAPALSAVVTEAVGREVVAVLADTFQNPDMGTIVLVLASPPV
jgi:uncharacterized protein YbcI